MKKTPEQLAELHKAFDDFADACGIPETVRKSVWRDTLRRGTLLEYLRKRAEFFKSMKAAK